MAIEWVTKRRCIPHPCTDSDDRPLGSGYGEDQSHHPKRDCGKRVKHQRHGTCQGHSRTYCVTQASVDESISPMTDEEDGDHQYNPGGGHDEARPTEDGVAWLANSLVPYGEELEAGLPILSGSFTRPVFAREGDVFHADYGPLGVSCTFDYEDLPSGTGNRQARVFTQDAGYSSIKAIMAHQGAVELRREESPLFRIAFAVAAL
jgi:hypothetical protein